MLKFQNIKTFLLKDMLQISQKKFLLLIKLKIQFLGLIQYKLGKNNIREVYYSEFQVENNLQVYI